MRARGGERGFGGKDLLLGVSLRHFELEVLVEQASGDALL